MPQVRRPEHTAPPELFYDEAESRKYTNNSHIIDVQQKLSERALELLAIPDDQPSFILDIGCGSGLSGDVLSANNHYWTGIDISQSMLSVAVEGEAEGDLILSDMGQGLPFRAGSFDGAISISALQWLCNADKKSHNPVKRLFKFFTTLYSVLSRGSRAVFQLYPETNDQLELITAQSMRAGFTGGVIVDYPNSTKAKKIFLCLMVGGGTVQELPRALTDSGSSSQVSNQNRRKSFSSSSKTSKPALKSREWILNKKERRRKQGLEVRPDTKYSGRKRPKAF